MHGGKRPIMHGGQRPRVCGTMGCQACTDQKHARRKRVPSVDAAKQTSMVDAKRTSLPNAKRTRLPNAKRTRMHGTNRATKLTVLLRYRPLHVVKSVNRQGNTHGTHDPCTLHGIMHAAQHHTRCTASCTSHAIMHATWYHARNIPQRALGAAAQLRRLAVRPYREFRNILNLNKLSHFRHHIFL
jgi:hypothetical protein